MKNDEIKQANRKALPKFLLFAVVCTIVGGVVGYYSGHSAAKGGIDKLVGIINETGAFFGIYLAPWLMLALAVIVPVVCIPIYRSAKKLVAAWDGEDEDISDTVDRKLSAVIWITSVALIVSYFLIAASYSGGFATFDSKNSTIIFFIGVVAFFGIMAEATIIQQKCVDTAKQTNPEKKASVYDMRFQKKWIDDCDEAEKIMIGKCAFKAYSATNVVCTVLAIVLAVCAFVFDIGFLPSLMVCLVWIVNLSVYCKEQPEYVGVADDFISSPRLDNLTSCAALVSGILDAERKDGINLIALFDHEEIGSRSKQGAGSILLHDMLLRILAECGAKESAQELLYQSMLLSVDVAHGLHPNQAGKMDITNKPVLGSGFCIKEACSQSYATDCEAIAIIQQICDLKKIPYQKFVNRSDMAGGGTLGSIASALLPVKTVDIGIPLLAMHSARELMGAADQEALTELVTAYFLL